MNTTTLIIALSSIPSLCLIVLFIASYKAEKSPLNRQKVIEYAAKQAVRYILKIYAHGRSPLVDQKELATQTAQKILKNMRQPKPQTEMLDIAIEVAFLEAYQQVRPPRSSSETPTVKTPALKTRGTLIKDFALPKEKYPC